MNIWDRIQKAASIFNKAGISNTPGVTEGQVPLTLEKAIEVFDLLADMNDIAFGYTTDGCYARAHIMCRRLIDMRITPQKAWARQGKAWLKVTSPTGETIRWCYHVAPTLTVKISEDNTRDMVIDPSLFDGPVSLKDWGDIMSAEPDRLEIAPFGTAPKGASGDYNTCTKTSDSTDASAAETMKNYLQYQKGAQRIVFSSQYREQAFSTQDKTDEACGTTWISLKALPKQNETVEKATTEKPYLKAPKNAIKHQDNPFLGV